MARPRLSGVTAGASRRVAAAVALVAVIAVIVIVIKANSSPSSPSAAGASVNAGAATVERRNLVATDTESGTLSYSDPQTVYNRLGGTITWLPGVGAEIKPGQALFRVNGQPVTLMSGSTPAYRTLDPDVSDGPDVLELNRNLVRLGFNSDGIIVDDVWQAGTTLGVEQFQESLGETPTGTLTLGQIVFLPGPQLISSVEGTLGATASTVLSPARPEFVSLESNCPTSTAPASTTSSTSCSPTSPTSTKPAKHRHHKSVASQRQLAALIALLKAEVAQLKAQHSEPPPSHGNSGGSHGHSGNKGDSGNSSHGSHNGDSPSNASNGQNSGGGGGGQAVLQTTSTQLVVTVDLDASLQSEATVGEHVTVVMPSGNTVHGTVTAVSSVATSSSNSGNGNGNGNGNGGGGSGSGSGNSGSSSTIPVTITLRGHQRTAGLDQAAVSVNFIKQRANHVLSVPVTALLATSGTSYAVQEASTSRQLIPVTTGLFAAGYVQISGSGIRPGLQVTDSQG